MGIGFDAYLREIYSFLARGLAVPILWQTHHISVTQEIFIALTGSSNALKEHDNISPDHSLYSFPIKFGQTFKNFIGNFTVANKV